LSAIRSVLQRILGSVHRCAFGSLVWCLLIVAWFIVSSAHNCMRIIVIY
jgi:hypothetical protein